MATLAGPSLAKKIGLVQATTLTQGISTAFMFAIPLSRSYVSAGVAFAARSFLMNMATPLEQSLGSFGRKLCLVEFA